MSDLADRNDTHLPFPSSDVEHGMDPAKVWKHRGIWCALYPSPVVDNGYNGYVMIPQGHPFREYDDYEKIPVDAHGGLTWGWENREASTISRDLVPTLPKDVTIPERKFSGEQRNWWIGFDTNHYMDTIENYSLAEIRQKYARKERFNHWRSKYTMDDVVRMTEDLAEQVAAVTVEWKTMELNAEQAEEHGI